jgi:MerR family transcriptional regulator, copper efflux regulator
MLEEKLIKVGELAKAVGKTVRAMHLYEELGLLRPVSRSAGGYRLYTEEAVARVKWIIRLQDMGFSLVDIQGFVKDWEESLNGPKGMSVVKAIFEAKLADTRQDIQRLQKLESDLRESLHYLETCTSCNPGHTQDDCGCCAEPGHDPLRTPDLVAGLAKSGIAKAKFDVPVGHLLMETTKL